MKIFNLPDLGEGLPDAEIVKWYVKVGDHIKVDSPLVAMETAKAVVDVPSPFAGTIHKLHGQGGTIIATGAPLVEYVDDLADDTPIRDTGTVAGTLEVSNRVMSEQATSVTQHLHEAVKATPAVRALAQHLQVDLTNITPTGPNNTITSKDIELAASNLKQAGDLELLKGARRAMAQAMQKSHQNIVPVTLNEDAILKNANQEYDISVMIIQAIATACKVEPALNAWFDAQAMGRRLIAQLDLGVAVDTADGLFVPIIRDAGSKDAKTLRAELNTLKDQVQNRTLKPEQMRGSSFVLSNFGKFAGRYATPIIIPPCVAILGVGKVRSAIVPINSQPTVTQIVPLSLTIDHRACTGGEASRFLGAVVEYLQANS